MNMADVALAERGDGTCSTVRIPTGRFPIYSETVEVEFQPADQTKKASFRANRDTLFTGLSVTIDGSLTPPFFSAEYCNTKLLVNVQAAYWAPCCARKPIFLQGVRENKTLDFDVTLIAPAVDVITVRFTLSGFQGKGCCA